MSMPAGFNTLNTYLIVPNSKEAMELYKKAFGAEGGTCMEMPDGTTMHAELKIGNSTVMLTDENPQWQMKSALTLGGSAANMHMYLEDAAAVDAMFNQAVASGMEVLMPPTEMFWGDYYGKVADKYGFQWGIATQTKELTEDELKAGQNAWLAEMAAQGGEGEG